MSHQSSEGTTADYSRGPTVERGLAALDSLYELRNVIPQLLTSSSLSDHDGEFQLSGMDNTDNSPQLGMHSGSHHCWSSASNA